MFVTSFVVLALEIYILLTVLWIAFQCLALAAAGIRIGRIMFGPLTIAVSSADPWTFKWHRPELSCLEHLGAIGVMGDSSESTEVLSRRFRTYDLSLLSLATGFVLFLIAASVISVLMDFPGIELASGLAVTIAWMGMRHLRYARWRERVRQAGVEAYDAQIAQWSVVWDSYAGHRPREWNRQRIEHLLSPAGHAIESPGTLLCSHLHLLDCGEIERSNAYLQRAVNMAMPMPESALRSGILLWASYIAATYHTDEASAKRLFEQGSGRGTRYEQLLPRAAMALLDGNRQLARDCAEQGLSLLHISDPGTARLDEEHYRRILDAAGLAV